MSQKLHVLAAIDVNQAIILAEMRYMLKLIANLFI